MKKIALNIAAIVASLLVCNFSARASTTTASMNVSATVDAQCIVAATNIAFPDYAPLGANLSNPDNSNADITLTCTAGAVAVISLSGGGHALAGQNRLAQGSSFINYNLYQDSSHSVAWGSGAAALTTSVAADTSPRTYVVYGQMPAAQSAPSGAYTDAVQVSVNF